MIPGEKQAIEELAAGAIRVSRALVEAKLVKLRGERLKEAEILTCALLADILKFRADFGFPDTADRSDAA